MSSTLLQTTATPKVPRKTALWTSAMILFSVGHWITDLFSSAVATLQPALTARHGLSLAEAGLLGGTFMFASSVLQLPFGMLSDRVRSRLYSVLGPPAAGVFLSSLGAATSFPALLALAFLGGVGVAAFHPHSTTEVTQRAAERRGTAAAFFITAGTFGLACGPVYFNAVIEGFGFERLSAAAAPALVLAGLLWWKLPAPAPRADGATGRVDWAALGSQWNPLARLYFLVFARSATQLGFGQFLTLFLVLERGFSMRHAGWVLALFFLAASTGSLLGGGLADRLGGKKVIAASNLLSPPLLAGFLLTDGGLSLVCLFLGAMTLLLTIPVNVVMAQRLVPSQAGTVTSLMMGFSWGVAGITLIPALGWFADQAGLTNALWIAALLPLPGLALAAGLPDEPRRERA